MSLFKRYFVIINILILSTILRLGYLNISPPSLYSDEADQGYNAYSILKTGKDEHGVLLPISLRSFGDWKPPIETYLMIPFIWSLGLNEYSVRTPSSLLGVLSILLIYLVVRKIFDNYQYKEKLSLLSAFLISFSPWHLHQSRSAMLVMIALFYFVLGLYCFILGLKKRGLLYVSITSFIFSIYSYYGMRVIVPIFCLFLFIYFRNELLKLKRVFLYGSILGMVLILPLIISFIYNPNVIFGRARTVSVFFDQGVKLKIWERETQDGLVGTNPTLTLFFHNKPYFYALDILKRFLQHFEGYFLFIKGDGASPFQIPNMGALYLLDAIFLPIGIYIAFKSNNKAYIFLSLLIVSVIPASLTFLTPSHNRTFNAVMPLMVFISFGIIYLTNIFRNNYKSIVNIFIVSIYIFSFHNYLINYYKILPKEYSREWLYGFKELTTYLNDQNQQFNKIYFLPETGMSYIYLLFYNQYSPEKFQIEAQRKYQEDRFGFEHVKGFSKYIFLSEGREWDFYQNKMEENEVYIGRETEIPQNFSKKEILYPNGKVAFRIYYL